MINKCKISASASKFVLFFCLDNIMLPFPLRWINQWAVEFTDFQFVLLAPFVYRMKSNNPPGPSRRLQTRNHAQPLARSRPPPPLLPHTDMQNLQNLIKLTITLKIAKDVADAESCAAFFPIRATSTPAAATQPPCNANSKNLYHRQGWYDLSAC